jgi:secretion/DNA translocation related CpaE-like protein
MPAPAPVRNGPCLPMVVTSDPDLLDDLLRLAAAAGEDLDVAPDPAAARPRYPGAPLILIGADQAVACLRARLPRRARVVLVGRRPGLEAVWRSADLLGVEYIAELPAAEPWIIDRLTLADEPEPSGRVVAVIGGRGGAGASILAAGLAVTAVGAGRRTLLVDADPLGGGLDLVLGWEQLDGLRWPALLGAGGRVDPPALLQALPQRGDLVLLSFGRNDLLPVPGEAMAATLDAGCRGRDLVIVDLPRHLDDASVLALQAAQQTLVVVPAELRATAAAARVAAMVKMHCQNVAAVVRGPAPGKLKAREVARALSLPLAGSLRPEPALCQGLERGEAPAASGRGPLAELCKELLGASAPSAAGTAA